MLTNPTKRLVYPDGDTMAKIALIGEAPGQQEERVGKGFVGPSGQLLFNIMAKSIGMTRADCYITNVIKERPRDNDVSEYITFKVAKAFPTQRYLDFEKMFYEEIDKVKANVFVAVGGVALYALTRKTGISKQRGSILTDWRTGRKVIPIIHPAAALRNYLFTHTISMDLKRVKEESAYPEVRLPSRHIKINPSYEDSVLFLSSCMSEAQVAFDIEVMRNEVSCVSFAKSPYDVISIPFAYSKGDFYTIEQECSLWRMIANILEDPSITKVGQNIVFDNTFIYRKYGIQTKNVKDTMICQAIMYPDFPKGLDFITAMHTKEPYYKDEGKKHFKIGGSDENFWIYNAKDSAVCLEALPRIEADLQRIDNLDAAIWQTRLVEPLVYLQERGIKIDVKGMEAESKRAGDEISNLTNKLHEITKSTLNPNSPNQLKEYFYKVKGEKPYVNRKTGGETVDKNALKRLARKGHEEAKILLEIRHLSKLKSTYLDVTLDTDNRLRCSFNPVGTESGRLSSSETIFDTGCLPPEAEVLTDFGWLPINQVVSGDMVCQFDPSNGQLSYTPAEPFSKLFEGNLIIGDTEQFKIAITPGHRILSKKVGRDTWSTLPAGELMSMSYRSIPLSGRLVGGHYTFTAPRLLAAILADGSYEGDKVRISFKKQRKTDRLLELLALYKIEYTEQSARDGYRRFAFYRPKDWPTKKWDIWVTMLDATTAECMADEAKYWDSTIRGDSFIFYTADKSQAEWFATLCHLTNRSATIREAEQADASWSDTLMYIVNVKPRGFAAVDKKHWTQAPYKGMVYCVSVKSSYFMVRYKGFISITGNTNMQNLPMEFRKYMIADDDTLLFNIDLSQAENRLVAYIAPEPNMIKAFEEKIDIHSQTGALISGLPIDEVKRQDKEHVFCHLGSQDQTWRFWGKKANHGLNYDLGYRTFSFYYEIPENDGKFICEKYHHAYPGVHQYHAWVRNQLSKDRTLTNIFGRKRLFLDRWDDELFKSAYSFIPQSSIADLLNRKGLIYVYENQDRFRPVDLLLQVHDSIVFQMNYKKHSWEEQAKCLIDIKNSLEADLLWKSTTFSIPISLEIGFNLDKKNMVEVGRDEFASVERLARRLYEVYEQLRASLFV